MYLLIAFALTYKTLKLTFFFFSLSSVFLDEMIIFLPLFHISLPRTRVTSNEPTSLGTLENVFVKILLIFVLETSGYYLLNMRMEFEKTHLKSV